MYQFVVGDIVGQVKGALGLTISFITRSNGLTHLSGTAGKRPLKSYSVISPITGSRGVIPLGFNFHSPHILRL